MIREYSIKNIIILATNFSLLSKILVYINNLLIFFSNQNIKTMNIVWQLWTINIKTRFSF